MSSPETSTEPVETNSVKDSNGHGEKREEEDEHEHIVDSPGAMSEVEDDDVHGGNGEAPYETSSDDDDDEEEESEDEDSEGLEDEDSDDDEEPALKYERIGGSIPDLLKKDSASALAISNRVMVSFLVILYNLGKNTMQDIYRLWERMAASCISSTSRGNESSPISRTKPQLWI